VIITCKYNFHIVKHILSFFVAWKKYIFKYTRQHPVQKTVQSTLYSLYSLETVGQWLCCS